MASTPKKISSKKLQEGIDSGIIVPAGTSGKYYKHSKNPDLTFSADDTDYFDDFDWNSSDFDIRKSFNQNDLAKAETLKKAEEEAKAEKDAAKKAKKEEKAKAKAEKKPSTSNPLKEIAGAMTRNQFGMGGAEMSSAMPSMEQTIEDNEVLDEQQEATGTRGSIVGAAVHPEDVPQNLHDRGIAVKDEYKAEHPEVFADAKEAEEKVKNGETSEVVKSPETPKEIKRPARSIWDAWLNGEFGDKDSDSAKKERDYLILDAIGTFAKNAGRQLGNVGAQYTGGSIDNDEDTSAWEQKQLLRNKADFANQAQKNAEADYDSPAGRQRASEILNLEMQQYMANKAATVQDLMDDWNAKANNAKDPVTALYYRDLVTKLAASGVSPMSSALQGIQGVSSIVGTVLGAVM